MIRDGEIRRIAGAPGVEPRIEALRRSPRARSDAYLSRSGDRKGPEGPFPAGALRGLAAAVLLALVAPAPALSQGAGDDIRSVRALRMPADAEIRLDGRLHEPFWDQADVATDFRQQEPEVGEPATETTRVRVAYDHENLYIGAVLRDSEPEGVLAYKRKRDAGLGTDDRFMWILDTFLDERTAYFFEINPAGLMGDGLMGADFNKAWDGIWEAHVERGDWGWSAEIRIPFSTLNFDPSLRQWGINFQRTVRRKNEEMLWEGHRPNQGLFNPTYAGRLTGLTDISQGVGVQVRPYALGEWRREPGAADPTDITVDAGFDLSYSLTPGLRAAATVNTDFAQVEVDQRRVNLTRFPLFFPEKRDFFLENSDVYTFAPSNDQEPFFSRRIGLVDGREVPIDAGLRLGGQAGDYELGLMQLRTGGTDFQPSEDFTVARVKRRILEESTIGIIYTWRATHEGADEVAPPTRHTLGFDALYFTSGFLGDRNLRAQAFGVWHSDPTRAGTSDFGDRSTRGVRLSYPNDIWRAHVSYREFGEEYDPAVGFVQRTGFRRLQPSVSYHPRPDFLPWIRQAEIGVRLEDLWSLDGPLLTRDRSFTLPGLNLESGDRMSFEFGWNTERLQEPFEIHDGVVLPVDVYETFDWTLSAETAGRRPVAGEVSVTHGEFWSGERTRWQGGLTVRPTTGVSARGEVVRNDVDLPQGEFTAQVYRLIGEWHPTPWVSLTQNWQYDDVSDVVGLQARLRWIVEPGNELYAVYTHNWRNRAATLDPLSPDLETISRDATTKLVYSLTF